MKFKEYINEQLTTYTTIRIIKDDHLHFNEEFQVESLGGKEEVKKAMYIKA